MRIAQPALYYPQAGAHPLAALVVKIHPTGTVSVAIWNEYGINSAQHHVPVGEQLDPSVPYVTAAETDDALDKAVSDTTRDVDALHTNFVAAHAPTEPQPVRPKPVKSK
jgi:hypothetical protein